MAVAGVVAAVGREVARLQSVDLDGERRLGRDDHHGGTDGPSGDERAFQISPQDDFAAVDAAEVAAREITERSGLRMLA